MFTATVTCKNLLFEGMALEQLCFNRSEDFSEMVLARQLKIGYRYSSTTVLAFVYFMRSNNDYKNNTIALKSHTEKDLE